MKKSVKKSKSVASIKDIPKSSSVEFPTMMIAAERDIALDFATKIYKNFENLMKAVIYFGSSAKQESTSESDIDLIILIDDVTMIWDEELISTYREELGKIIQANPYRKSLHINTVKLSTWWQDLMRGDPVVINVLRYGEALIDYGGFFVPLKNLLKEGKIRSTPESIYTLLERAPMHMARARASIFNAVDGWYWACVDSAHACLIAANIMPPSPEKISEIMKEEFVKKRILKDYYVDFYSEIHDLAKDIVHGTKVELSGKKLDELKQKTDDFVKEMSKLVEELIKNK